MTETSMSTTDEKNDSPLPSVGGEKPDSDNSLVESEDAPQERYSFIGMLFILLALILCVFLVNIPGQYFLNFNF